MYILLQISTCTFSYKYVYMLIVNTKWTNFLKVNVQWSKKFKKAHQKVFSCRKIQDAFECTFLKEKKHTFHAKFRSNRLLHRPVWVKGPLPRFDWFRFECTALLKRSRLLKLFEGVLCIRHSFFGCSNVRFVRWILGFEPIYFHMFMVFDLKTWGKID